MTNKSKSTFVDPPYRVYIAAPFFNEQQQRWCEMLEKQLDVVGWEYFSPRLQHDSKPDMSDPHYASETFIRNVRAIDWANVMIANVDYLQPPGYEVRLLDSQQPLTSELPFKSGPLNIPDPGTMWELGLAFPRKMFGTMAVVLVTQAVRRQNWKPNLMLAKCANEVVFDSEQAISLLCKYGEGQFGKFYNHRGDVV